MCLNTWPAGNNTIRRCLLVRKVWPCALRFYAQAPPKAGENLLPALGSRHRTLSSFSRTVSATLPCHDNDLNFSNSKPDRPTKCPSQESPWAFRDRPKNGAEDRSFSLPNDVLLHSQPFQLHLYHFLQMTGIDSILVIAIQVWGWGTKLKNLC